MADRNNAPTPHGPGEKPRAAAPGPKVLSLGCRLNAFEAEVMRRKASEAGLDNAIIVNTCAVTAESERQCRQTIRRARRDHPDAPLIVTGCAAQIDPAAFASMAEVDHVIGNDDKLKTATFATIRSGAAPRVAVNDIMRIRETAGHLVDGFEGRARAFLEVQQGCDHRCTFCIIPFGRGPSRSVPPAEVERQARHLAASGYREIVLTGVDLTAYGGDLPGEPRLGDLVARLLGAVPELTRLRLSSVDVAEIDPGLFELIAGEPRVMPHLHLSLQSGDDLILKRMKRRHTRAQAIALCEALRTRRPEIVFGADLIAGFPTESDAMFKNTCRLVEDCGLTWLHVFPYSPRQGTPASRMPGLDPALVKARARHLRTLAESARDRFLAACIGGEEEMLIEQTGLGRTPRYAQVMLDETPTLETPTLEAGAVIRATITGHDRGRLIARPLPAQGRGAEQGGHGMGQPA